MKLPTLDINDLKQTRDSLRDYALILSNLQRVFMPKNEHDWQYGLEVSMRGIVTQEFHIGNEKHVAIIDLVTSKIRLDNNKWLISEFSPKEIQDFFIRWLESKNLADNYKSLELIATNNIDQQQLNKYAEALWWVNLQFNDIKKNIAPGLVSPILLYPHHFDLALSWFPFNDDRQISIGFSTGDNNIVNPYFYLTVYPDSKELANIKPPTSVYLNSNGFNGLVLDYSSLQKSDDPSLLLKRYTETVLDNYKQLLI